MSLRRPPRPRPPSVVTSSLGTRGPVGTHAGRALSQKNIFVITCLYHRTSRGDSLRLTGRGDPPPPGRPVLQQRAHPPHQVVRRRHQRDLLPLRVVTPSPLEVRPPRRRPPHRLPTRLGEQL